MFYFQCLSVNVVIASDVRFFASHLSFFGGVKIFLRVIVPIFVDLFLSCPFHAIWLILLQGTNFHFYFALFSDMLCISFGAIALIFSDISLS